MCPNCFDLRVTDLHYKVAREIDTYVAVRKDFWTPCSQKSGEAMLWQGITL